MNTMSGRNDAQLKEILTSWNVSELYNFFREEDICLEDLKIIKYRHIDCLLSSYKMGVRIRFEHYLEVWRKELGKPLHITQNQAFDTTLLLKALATISKTQISHQTDTSVNGNRNCQDFGEYGSNNINHRSTPVNGLFRPDDLFFENVRREENIEINQPKRRKSSDTRLDEHNKRQAVPISRTSQLHEIQSRRRSENDLIHMPLITVKSEELLMPASVINEFEDEPLENCGTDSMTQSYLSVSNLPESIVARTAVEPSTDDENTPNFLPRIDRIHVTLSQIMSLSGKKGLAIKKFYQENNHLTAVHRSQLINLIVEYFDEHDYHLSLNMSHNLEWEILKMFPTEKLENYRTERRGKIYVKYSNTKRFKRDRLTPKTTVKTSQIKGDGNADNSTAPEV